MNLAKFSCAILYSTICLCIPGKSQSYLPEKNNIKIKVGPIIKPKAYAFNLKDIRLLDGPFRHTMQMDSAYLLVIEPNRLLHRFYTNAGLPDKGKVYGGWESEGLSGHTMGHYLSACSMMFASTGNREFKTRVDYIVGELKKFQDARKTGYVGAIPNEDSIFGKLANGQIRSSGFDLNGGWSPWYTVHKLMAGLLDAYLYCDNKLALTIVEGMADWTEKTLKNLNEEQLLKMLNCEYGGMNDVLVNLYSITGTKKYLELSYKFHDKFVLGQLAKQIDPMPGKHSNTNVPKAIGCARRYELTGSAEDSTIAAFFWQTMVHHHSYVIGGNSNYEYCGEEDKLSDRLSDNTCETCNTYNMLKLTRHLFSWQPNSKFVDYYERALYNHILASQNPTNGMMCYFVPLRMGTQKEFSDSFNTFTCCVGSGMENHSKYTEGIYYEGNDASLLVNLFIASELNWKEKGILIKQETSFPVKNLVKFSIRSKSPQKFALKLRHPAWAKGSVKIKLNGKIFETKENDQGYFVINRTWNNDDRVEMELPMDLYTEAMPDNPNRIAFLYGPLVLAGKLGKEMPDPVYGVPVLLTENKNVAEWLKPVPDQPLTFTMEGVGKPFNATLSPFYTVYDQHYSVYWDYFTNAEWNTRAAEYEAEKKRQKEIEEKTIDIMRLGEMQPERDHNFQATEKSYTSDALGRTGREVRDGGFFSFDMKVDSSTTNNLLCTYIGDDKNRIFDILIDGVKIATQELNEGKTGVFYDKIYPIPQEIIKGKTKVVVRIQAYPGKTAGRIFGCRTIKN
ncbi:MAG: hypothetical protein C5B52_11435 [Bacteroidetes bacterium]|nr:MAG: hypothetical protein C5B52_11435 [Bacteroidota bacterium]